MLSESPAQKHLSCMAYAYKRHGESVIKMANSMPEEELKDYCLQPVKE